MRQCFGKYIIAWPALGEPEVALALERLQRAQQHRLAAGASTQVEEPVERAERHSADAAIGREIGIVRAIAVERGERALEEGDGNRRTHVDPGVEQLGGQPRAAGRDFVEARPQPVEAAVDARRFASRQQPHRSGVAMGTRNGLGDSEARRAALVRRMVNITALAIDQRLDQAIDIHRFHHAISPSSRHVLTK